MAATPILPASIMILMFESPFAMGISFMPVMVMSPVVRTATPFHIKRRIFMRIPVIFDKIDRHTARVITMTVLVPMLGMPRRNT